MSCARESESRARVGIALPDNFFLTGRPPKQGQPATDARTPPFSQPPPATNAPDYPLPLTTKFAVNPLLAAADQASKKAFREAVKDSPLGQHLWWEGAPQGKVARGLINLRKQHEAEISGLARAPPRKRISI